MTMAPRPCPDCGAPTAERRSNRPGVARWFPCTRYPACKGAIREFTSAAQGMWEGSTPARHEAPVMVAAPRFQPSPFQQAIFDFIKTGTGNGVVEAVAGSGKTTTMVQALGLTSGRVLFTAFNAAIAKELSTRAPGHVTVSTLHALGLRAVKKAFPDVAVDKDGEKLEVVTLAAFPVKPGSMGDENLNVRKLARRVVALAKATLVDPADVAAVGTMMDRYGVDADDSADLVRVSTALRGMLDGCAGDTSRIDFDDMVWLPVRLGLSVEKYDWIFVDETQDMNANQLELIMKARRDGTRVVCIGDRFQSIYGFRGADCEAMPNIIKRLGATVLPLSITYRCPVSHVKLAAELVPTIQARPGAPEGTISDMVLDKAMGVMTAGDLVLCRTNAPLVGVAFGLIRAGKKAIIRGRDLGTGLVSLIRKLGKGGDFSEFMGRLAEYRTREMDKLTRTKKSTVALEDKCETITVLAEGCDTVECMIRKVEAIFSDTDAGVVCSSVHRAKGFEASRVFIVKPELMPHPSAKRAWARAQESNIKYVALTRSKSEMGFVSVPEKG